MLPKVCLVRKAVITEVAQTSELVKVFVYGTLKPGGASYQRYCSDYVVEAYPMLAKGQLFALPVGYPAMSMGEGWVHGFLLWFQDAKILNQLDEYEGYELGRSPQQNLYQRELIEVFNPMKKPRGFAWAYLMTSRQICHRGGVLLPEGRWK